MNPIRDIAQRQEAYIDHVEENFKSRALIAAFDATALMKSRHINDRVDHTGSSFGLYEESTQKQKVRNRQDRSSSNVALFDSGFSSLPYPNVNFNDTGAMQRQTKPVILSESLNSCTIRIEPTGDRKEVLGHLENRFGVILKLSIPEEEFIIAAFDDHNDRDLIEFGLR